MIVRNHPPCREAGRLLDRRFALIERLNETPVGPLFDAICRRLERLAKETHWCLRRYNERHAASAVAAGLTNRCGALVPSEGGAA